MATYTAVLVVPEELDQDSLTEVLENRGMIVAFLGPGSLVQDIDPEEQELRLAIVGPDLSHDNLDRPITVCWCGRSWPGWARSLYGDDPLWLGSCPVCHYREPPAWNGVAVGDVVFDEFAGPWACEGRQHTRR